MFNMKSIKKRILGFSNSEKGFTLIEIIAVLVILGILAAIAVPKYLDVQEGARQLAAQSGINELNARANMAHAHLVLNSVVNGSPANISDIDLEMVAGNVNALLEPADDYAGFMETDGNLTITSVLGEALPADILKQWNLPNF